MGTEALQPSDRTEELRHQAYDARQQAEADAADTLFDDYMIGEGVAVDTVDDYIFESELTDALLKMLRDNYLTDSKNPLHRGNVYGAYQYFIAKACERLVKA